jgi:phosphoserine phosphatase RsbU/P
VSTAQAPAETTRAIAPGRILVVDDNEMNRDLLSRRLQRQGHAVEVAVHGLQALDWLRAAEFDVVLLDIMMPEMNGYELLAHLRADAALRHLPVILISAMDDAESVVRGIEMGADDHLPKPFNVHILRARVEACLAKKRLHDREQVHARGLERELEIGRQIQRGFLPERLIEVPGWEVAVRFEPARQVAGDFYDTFRLPDGRMALVVADVCDKGVGAALFMAIFRSLTRVFAAGTDDPTDPHAVLRRTVLGVNDYIATTHSRANMFATIFLGVLDPATGALHYVNAGHDAPLLIGRHGGCARLPPTGPAVGLFPGMEFGVEARTIAPGDLLLGFTDGVTDARGEDGTPFGEARLLAALRGAEPAATALERVMAAVALHAGVEPAFDDVTLLALRRLPEA